MRRRRRRRRRRHHLEIEVDILAVELDLEFFKLEFYSRERYQDFETGVLHRISS